MKVITVTENKDNSVPPGLYYKEKDFIKECDRYCENPKNLNDGVIFFVQAKKKNYKVWIKSATDHIHNIAVQGPNSRKILEKFVWTAPIQPSITELEWFRFNIARIQPIRHLLQKYYLR